jgi:tRNA modification GTPase
MAMGSSSELSSVLAGGADTIVARATAAGRGALAVIRVSGPATAAVAAAVCPGADVARGWRATLVGVRGRDGQILDRGVAVTFRAPRSYTGEDMIELTVHGSPYLVERILDACVAAGARRAEPGEFTRRAVANGKLDLVQAEAVRDLVAAETAWQLRNAREQLAGVLSREFQELRDELVALAALVDASLEFEAQAVVVPEAEIRDQAARCLRRVVDLVGTADAGTRIRDGLRVVIIGPPNAGKSTLFNYLSGRDRAIVSPEPGTTRDVLEAEIELGGVRLVIQDTAGLRVGGDEVEEEGRRRAAGAAAAADLVVVLWAGDGPETTETPSGIPAVRLRSKADLGGPVREGWLPVSCRTGEGLDELKRRLTELALGGVADLGGAVAVAARHRAALERAREALDSADWSAPELAAEHVQWALQAAAELLGEVDDETVLDEVFAAFCVGK